MDTDRLFAVVVYPIFVAEEEADTLWSVVGDPGHFSDDKAEIAIAQEDKDMMDGWAFGGASRLGLIVVLPEKLMLKLEPCNNGL